MIWAPASFVAALLINTFIVFYLFQKFSINARTIFIFMIAFALTVMGFGLAYAIRYAIKLAKEHKV